MQLKVNWPEIPEGYFFRVKEGPFGVYPWVELRKKNRWIGSREVGSAYQDSVNYKTTEEEVEFLARMLTKDFLRKEERKKEIFTGDFR